MQLRARQFREFKISGDHHVFRGGRHAMEAEFRRHQPLMRHATFRQVQAFAMVHNGQIKCPRIFQSPTHDHAVHHRFAIV